MGMNSLILLFGAILAGVLAWLSMAGAVHFTSRRQHGYLHWAFYVMLFVAVANVWLMDRDLTTNYLIEDMVGQQRKHPLMATIQPLLSLLLLVVACERIVTHWLVRKDNPTQPVMLIGFVIFWLGTTASPALLGAHPNISHDYLYPLFIGLAAAAASPREHDMALKAVRNAIFLLMLAGLALIPFKPTLVMDMNYSQGLIPGLPRFASLAMHSVSMGLLTQLCLLCLLAKPFENRWVNRGAWAVGLTVLLIAQSKTAWLAFVLCSGAMLMWRWTPAVKRHLGNPFQPAGGIALLLLFMAAVTAFVLMAMFGQVGERIERFINTPEGAQLATLTGRDRIWAIAWDEWRQHPIFGYGPELWGDAYRKAIGMRNATHGHNQFMDTLSRSGLVGAITLVAYAVLLLVLSLRYARITRGLSLALFIALFLRALSEVPLLLFGYGPELIAHVLLFMTLSAASQARAVPVAQVRVEPRPSATAWQQRPGTQRPTAFPGTWT